MNMDNLTSGFLDALNEAQRQALGNDNQFIEPVHLMKAFLQQKDGSVVALLKMLGTDLTGFENDIDSQISSLPQVTAWAETSSSRRSLPTSSVSARSSR